MSYAPNATPVVPPRRGLSTGAVIGIVAGGLTLVLAAAIVIGVVVSGHDTIRLKATGVSMEPTIRAGQTVTAEQITAGKYQPERGDIVVFNAPASWRATDANPAIVKRVIGLPGDRVSCCDSTGRWLVDGQPLSEPYVATPGTDPPFDILVPDDRLWVMGDNRLASNDSRRMFLVGNDIGMATIPISAVTALVQP
ncbi:MAG: signal peptidase I [Hamadaea sp.]|nr:signal peptidase I [Hamadaea sp.]